MRTLEAEVEITRPVPEVYGYVTEPENWPVWAGPVVAVHTIDARPLRSDARFTTVVKLVGKQFETIHRVTAFEQDKLFSYVSESGPVPSTFTWQFASVSAGTVVTQTIFGDEERTASFFRLAFPLVEAVVQRQMRADLETLKDVLESKA